MNKFIGKFLALDGYVYDAGLPNSNQDLFAMTMDEIAEYISREYNQAWEFTLGLVELNLLGLVAPVPPASLDLVTVEIWKLDVKEYHEWVKNHDANVGKFFSLVLGWCSQTIHDRLEALVQ